MMLATRIRGSGRPIMLLPWFGLDSAVMAAAFEPVLSSVSGWCRIYVDLPGTGESPPVAPHSDAALEAVRDTITSTVDEVSFLLAGCSYGGYLATGLVRREPTRVAGLLTVCAGVRIRPEERDLSGVSDSTPQPGWLDGTPERLHGHFDHAIGQQTRAVADRIADAFQRNAPADDDYLDALRSTGYQLSDETVPRRFDGVATIMAGRRDRIAGYLDHFDALSHYRHGNFVALAEAGHYLPFEQPDHFRSVTLDWLARAEQAMADATA